MTPKTTKHKCQFTIPVEWEYITDTFGTETALIPMTVGRRVTRLRCICGKEIDR